jgi:integrase
MSRSQPPSYRQHKPSGQAVVTLSGKDHYLGRYDSPESHQRYDELVAQWLATGRKPLSRPGAGITINELADRYQEFAGIYYRKHQIPTSEVGNVKYALKHLRDLFGSEPAAEFASEKLEVVQNATIQAGLCLNECNRRVKILKRLFKWAAKKKFVTPTVAFDVSCCDLLKEGRCAAKATEPILPVPEPYVAVLEPYLSKVVWTMVQLQKLTGARPGEITQMRTMDITKSGEIWWYVPRTHKLEHLKKTRIIPIGPQAQQILKPFLRLNLEEPLFQPSEAVAEMQERRSRNRKTIRYPSDVKPRKRNPKVGPKSQYSVVSYNRAISEAIRKANEAIRRTNPDAKEIPHWSVGQLRHNAATAIRKRFGIEASSVILGHSSISTTEIYAERNMAQAAEIARLIG